MPRMFGKCLGTPEVEPIRGRNGASGAGEVEKQDRHCIAALGRYHVQSAEGRNPSGCWNAGDSPCLHGTFRRKQGSEINPNLIFHLVVSLWAACLSH